MKNEILKLIYDSTINNKDQDKNFFYELINKAIILNDVQKEIDTVDLYENNIPIDLADMGTAGYNVQSKNLFIKLNDINKLVDKYMQPIYIENLNDQEIQLLKYLIGYKAITHELTHAHQRKLLIQQINNNDIESVLLVQSFYRDAYILNEEIRNNYAMNGKNYMDFYNFSLKYTQMYNQNYNLILYERLAETTSYDALIELIEPIKTQYSHLQKLFDELKHTEYITSYIQNMISSNEIFSPTYTFLENINLDFELQKIDIYSTDIETAYLKAQKNHDLDTRVRLGLPVKKDEINQYIRQKIK